MRQARQKQIPHFYSESKQMWCYHGILNTDYYKLPVIKSLKNFQEMFSMGYSTYFRKKKHFFFHFFPKNQPIYHQGENENY